MLSQYFLAIATALLTVPTADAQSCPIQVDPPCICSRTLFEQINILCDGAGSLNDALRAISRANNEQIDSLTIKNTIISRLDANAFAGLTIIRLTLNKNQLASIDERAFDGILLDSLQELDLKDNQLGTVPAAGLAKLRKLKKLYLSRNGITQLTGDTFSQFEASNYLMKLDLSYNKIDATGFRNGASALRPLRVLEEFSIEANALNSLTVATNALAAQRNSLKNLNIGLNNISDVPINALQFPNLESLSLEFNSISFIQAEAFRGVPSLLYLYLTGNHFQQWYKEMYRYINALQILGIGETAISVIPVDAFEYIPSLVRLEMSEAAVDSIQQGAFQRTPELQALIMNGNRLQLIPVWMFNGLSKIYTIDLQGNRLSRIENSAFANLPALRHLDISNNELVSLEDGTFEQTFLPKGDTRVLYVCGNPWTCDGRLAWFRQWLRENPSIVIDKQPVCQSVCETAPEWFPANLPLRRPDPPRPITVVPTTETPAPVVRVAATGPTLGWIILAVIMSILLISICLLALARYFISRKHKQEKDDVMDDEAKLAASSQVGGYASAGGAGSVIGGYSASPYGAGPAGSVYPGSQYLAAGTLTGGTLASAGALSAAAGYGTWCATHHTHTCQVCGCSMVDLDLPPAHSLRDDPQYYPY